VGSGERCGIAAILSGEDEKFLRADYSRFSNV
jgi:hypothetical protein